MGGLSETELLEMFPNGKWQNSTLMNSFLNDTENFLYSKVLPTTLGGVPKFIRTVNEKIEQLCRTPYKMSQ